MTVQELNSLPYHEAAEQLTICCGSSIWVEKMANLRPFLNRTELLDAAKNIWFSLTNQDWLEAFEHHPKIGDLESIRNKFQKTAEFSLSEQIGLNDVSEDILIQLEKGNRSYENKFGHTFIICATGKNAEEMLALLQDRLNNNPKNELLIATNNQNEITKLRIEKLIDP